jgi:hypothetical protein
LQDIFAVEGALLDFGHVEVVGPDDFAQGAAGEIAYSPGRDGLGEGAGDVRDTAGFVGVAAKFRFELETSLDAVQAGGQHGSVGEIRVGVATGQAVLDA